MAAVGRLMSSVAQVIAGQKGAEPSLAEFLEVSSAEGMIALRLCASDILVAHEATATRPAVASLHRIVGAVVGVPIVRMSTDRASALDRATAEMLRRVGVQGFSCSAPAKGGSASPSDPWQLVEWASARRQLAIPNFRSSERTTLMTRRDCLLDAVVLALLDSNVLCAAAGLRWLAVLPRPVGDSDMLLDAVHRAELLAPDLPQVRFDCCLARKLLKSRR